MGGSERAPWHALKLLTCPQVASSCRGPGFTGVDEYDSIKSSVIELRIDSVEPGVVAWTPAAQRAPPGTAITLRFDEEVECRYALGWQKLNF